jgi:hypothetical protein
VARSRFEVDRERCRGMLAAEETGAEDELAWL